MTSLKDQGGGVGGFSAGPAKASDGAHAAQAGHILISLGTCGQAMCPIKVKRPFTRSSDRAAARAPESRAPEPEQQQPEPVAEDVEIQPWLWPAPEEIPVPGRAVGTAERDGRLERDLFGSGAGAAGDSRRLGAAETWVNQDANQSKGLTFQALLAPRSLPSRPKSHMSLLKAGSMWLVTASATRGHPDPINALYTLCIRSQRPLKP